MIRGGRGGGPRRSPPLGTAPPAAPRLPARGGPGGLTFDGGRLGARPGLGGDGAVVEVIVRGGCRHRAAPGWSGVECGTAPLARRAIPRGAPIVRGARRTACIRHRRALAPLRALRRPLLPMPATAATTATASPVGSLSRFCFAAPRPLRPRPGRSLLVGRVGLDRRRLVLLGALR